MRPLLTTPKTEIYDYAKNHHLAWREDPTNLDTKYSRNWIRHKVIPKFSEHQRAQLLNQHHNLSQLNIEIDQVIDQTFFVQQPINQLARKKYINLPHEVAAEVCAMWLRKNKLSDFDKRTIEKLTVDLKRLQVGKKVTIAGAIIQISKDFFIFNSSQK